MSNSVGSTDPTSEMGAAKEPSCLAAEQQEPSPEGRTADETPSNVAEADANAKEDAEDTGNGHGKQDSQDQQGAQAERRKQIEQDEQDEQANQDKSVGCTETVIIREEEEQCATGASSPSWFATDPSKAYYEKCSLIWAPLSLITLLVGVLGTPLYEHCDRNSFLAISIIGCLPGFVIPLFFPCPADRERRFTERFWVKATVWISIFGFYGNYFWTHYFYHLLGAEYLFDSYKLNDVPIVCFMCTFFYFTFYFNFVNLILRRIAYLTRDLPSFGRALIRWVVITTLSYGTAVFEAVSIQHFPLYTSSEDWDTFVLIGSMFYGLYFVVGFPMFFAIDEEPRENGNLEPCKPTHTLGDAATSALAATAIVTLLLDVWRLVLGSLNDLASSTNVRLPFIYQRTTSVVPEVPSSCAVPIPSPEVIYVEKIVTVNECVDLAKTWAQKQAQSVTAIFK